MSRLQSRIAALEAAAAQQTRFDAKSFCARSEFINMTLEDWQLIADGRWVELSSDVREAFDALDADAGEALRAVHRERWQRAAPSLICAFLQEKTMSHD